MQTHCHPRKQLELHSCQHFWWCMAGVHNLLLLLLLLLL
jgi:hypothetical protein